MIDLISIIIPVYQVEDYVTECMQSIISQTYTNIEILVINDGSRDKSIDLCRDFAYTDSRIKIIDKQNGGLSSARNSGLDIAKGKFICFIDSDDFIDSNMIMELHNAIIETNADFVMSGIIKYINGIPSDYIKDNFFYKFKKLNFTQVAR